MGAAGSIFDFLLGFTFIVGTIFLYFYIGRKWAVWYIKIDEILNEIDILKKKRCDQQVDYQHTVKMLQTNKNAMLRQNQLCERSLQQIRKLKQQSRQSEQVTSDQLNQLSKKTNKIENITKNFKFNRIKRSKNAVKQTTKYNTDALKYM